jgi:hypothetical protein
VFLGLGQKHLVAWFGQYSELLGPSCHIEGLKELLKHTEAYLDEIFETNRELVIIQVDKTRLDKKKINNKICWIIEKSLENEPKSIWKHSIKDHCHITGRFRGMAQSVCDSVLYSKVYVPKGFQICPLI